MTVRRLVRSFVFGTLLVAASGASARADVDFAKASLVKRDGGYVLVRDAKNSAASVRWALVEVNNPDGTRRCESLKKVAARASYRFECPIGEATAGQRYVTVLRVFEDAKLDDRVLFEEPAFEIDQKALDAAGADTPGAGASVVADGVEEGAESPQLPATFKPMWYRRLDRGFSLRAYENSGDLTVGTEDLAFVDGKKTVRVPYASITSIRWEGVPNDLANHWMVVRFTNAEGKADGVAFRYGGMLGVKKGTGMVYLVTRRAAKK